MISERSGFTLVELSIVLVIIGLVIGGVLVGSDLIYQGQTRKMMAEIESIGTRVNAFKLKYNCLPGDCPNAREVLGDDCHPDPICEGDGDGMINPLNDDYTLSGSKWEVFKFWNHLFAAGMAPIGSGSGWTPGVDVPESVFPGAIYMVAYHRAQGAHFIWMGTPNPDGLFTAYMPHNPVFTPREALSIDMKYDDGIPTSGTISAINGYGGYGTHPCYSGTSYETNSDKNCAFLFGKKL